MESDGAADLAIPTTQVPGGTQLALPRGSARSIRRIPEASMMQSVTARKTSKLSVGHFGNRVIRMWNKSTEAEKRVSTTEVNECVHWKVVPRTGFSSSKTRYVSDGKGRKPFLQVLDYCLKERMECKPGPSHNQRAAALSRAPRVSSSYFWEQTQFPVDDSNLTHKALVSTTNTSKVL